jgi:hypothetical protein
LATTATTTSAIGAYAITQGSLAASSNYAIAYTSGALTVTSREIMVMAGDATRKHGTANPALSKYSVGGDGLYGSDSLITAPTLTTNAIGADGTNLGSNVGNYTITASAAVATSNYTITAYIPGTLTITASDIVVTPSVETNDNRPPPMAWSKYAIAYPKVTLTITARDITVVAASLTRKYVVNNPAGTYTLSGDGRPDSDKLATVSSLTRTQSSGVGGYKLSASGAAAWSNYNVTAYTPETLTMVQSAKSSMVVFPTEPPRSENKRIKTTALDRFDYGSQN